MRLGLAQLGLILLLCSCQKQSAATIAQPTPSATPVQYYGHPRTPSPKLQFIEAVDLGNGQQIVKHEIHHAAAEKIDIFYPQIVGSIEPFVAKVNAAIKSFVTKDRYPVKRKSRQRVPGEYEYEIVIKYSVELATNDVLSVAFHEYWRLFGAAHPGESYHAFNYNWKTNQVLKLQDLFRKDAKYLERLSEYCNDALIAQTGYPVEGLTPDPKNFLTWHLTKDSLCIDFDRCDHMPCGPGEQIVAIPYAELKDIVNLEGVLKSLVSP
jgi:hypothetical protein